MFYRRKIVLAILQAFDNTLEKIALQKLLFLFTIRQQKPDYDFVPYLYGCFSFSAYADLNAMVRNGNITEDKSLITKIEKQNYIATLNAKDQQILSEVKKTYGSLSSKSLMKLTYLHYQYYAINSRTAKELLDEEQYIKVLNAKPVGNSTILFTIGYEGISLEEYLNRLIKNDVKVLIDVRNNPMSMKFGFSKSQLKAYCENLGIQYVHIPEVGIRSEQRQTLNTQADYDMLFTVYRSNNLSKTTSYQEQILSLLKQNERVALTCFEANICQCHRKHLAEAITRLPEWNFELKHI
jgi:uncharacterized protein (DUF488 family)